jgi:hypothetical protein
MNLNFNLPLIHRETGSATADALRKLERHIAEIRAGVDVKTSAGDIEITLGGSLVVHFGIATPPHPILPNILAFWLYSPAAAPWQLAYSAKKTDGSREWTGLPLASS